MVEHLDRRARNEKKASGLVPVSDGADRRKSHLSRGWYWGGQEFAERVLRASSSLRKARRSRAFRGSPERLAHGEEEARTLLGEGLYAAQLDKKTLRTTRANDPRKALLAAVIWKNTTVGQAWIAGELEMKTAANVSLAINRLDWNKTGERVPAALRSFVKKMQ
jgi:hypothetical protein